MGFGLKDIQIQIVTWFSLKSQKFCWKLIMGHTHINLEQQNDDTDICFCPQCNGSLLGRHPPKYRPNSRYLDVGKCSRQWGLYQSDFENKLKQDKQQAVLNTFHGSALESSDPHELAGGFEVCQMKGKHIGASELTLFKFYEIGLLRIRTLCFWTLK